MGIAMFFENVSKKISQTIANKITTIIRLIILLIIENKSSYLILKELIICVTLR